MDLKESYAFDGGNSFAIGGTLEDFEDLDCAGGAKDELFESEIKPIEVENAFAKYNASGFHTHPTYW